MQDYNIRIVKSHNEPPPRVLPPNANSKKIPPFPRWYYYGIPSQAQCVGSSKPATVLKGDPPCRLRFPRASAGKPPFSPGTSLIHKMAKIVDASGCRWTSFDVVRIERGPDGDPTAPDLIWIGIMPPTDLTFAAEAVEKCAALLREHGIEGVEVEMRESEVMLF